MPDREPKIIIGVGRMNEHAVLVEYSDNTSVIYTADQLANLAPIESISEDEIEEEDAERDERNVMQFPQRTAV